jgi:hypothetical protein
MSDRYYILYRWWQIYNSSQSMDLDQAKHWLKMLLREQGHKTPILVKEVSTAEVGE